MDLLSFRSWGAVDERLAGRLCANVLIHSDIQAEQFRPSHVPISRATHKISAANSISDNLLVVPDLMTTGNGIILVLSFTALKEGRPTAQLWLHTLFPTVAWLPSRE